MGAGRKSPFAPFRGAAEPPAKGSGGGASEEWDGGSAGEYVNGDTLWNEGIAGALGYGKK
jgi:hypothetical protein